MQHDLCMPWCMLQQCVIENALSVMAAFALVLIHDVKEIVLNVCDMRIVILKYILI